MKSIDELNLWDPADEAIFDAYMAEERAKREADPDYQRSKRNTQYLARTLAYMLYPPGPYRFEGAEERHGRLEYYNSASREMAKGEYPQNKEEVFFRALDRYIKVDRGTTDKLSYEAEVRRLSERGLLMERLILEANEAAKWAYKLGAALYIHQQMVVRNKCEEPSQGKSQWLVANAPLTPPLREGSVKARKDGGEPARIASQWKKYHHAANHWAAFVLWAKTPLSYPHDSFPLVDFVLHADFDEFEANANAFAQFRTDVHITRQKAQSFIKKGYERPIDWSESEYPPPSQSSIPDLLEPYQWAVLTEYMTPKRPDRKTGS